MLVAALTTAAAGCGGGGGGGDASSATAVEMSDEACAEAPDDMKTVILDRPFVYFIVDTKTMLPIFSGIVEEIPA